MAKQARASCSMLARRCPLAPGAVHVDASIHPDIEQRRAVGHAVDADGRQAAAEARRCSNASMPASSIARSRRRTSFGALMSATVVVVWSCRKGPFSSDGSDHFRYCDRSPGGRAAVPAGLTTAISSSIVDGRLRAGAKLPASRELAERLGLSRTVVVAAYEQLLAEGYVAGRIGSGTYVASDLPDRPRRTRIDRSRPAAPRATARRGLPARSTSPSTATTARSISAAR